MPLTLSVLRCPDAVPPETRTVTGGEFSIGRGPDNDWTLADPDRFLSKRHCVLAFRAGGWQLADVSTNGTFLNRDAEPVGHAAPRDLRDGDRLRLGNYEIEARIEEDAVQGWGQPAAAGHGRGAPPGGGYADPFADDPFAPPPGHGGFGSDPLLNPGTTEPGFGQAPVKLPENYDPMAPDPFDAPFTGPTQGDHASAIEHSFQLPTHATPPVIPDDEWDIDLSTPMAPPPSHHAPPTAPAPPPPAPPPHAPPPPVSPPVAPAAPPPQAREAAVEDPFGLDDLAPLVPAPAPPAAAPPASPPPDLSAMPAASPFAEPDDLPPAPVPPAPVVPAPPVAMAPPPPIAAPADPGDLMAAFLRGARMEDARPADPAAAMEQLGAAFRAMVSGLRQALIARASIKGEFRIEQTMLRARGNNPLKFSAGDDDALGALVGTGRRSDMPPAEAVADSLRDMRLHELASMAAMQAAVRALLDRFDPAPLRAEGEKAGGMLPAQKRARAFEAFEKLHGEVSRALADDFDSVFGKAFARAYEQAMTEAAGKERN